MSTMSDPERGVNATQVQNDILLRLVGATEEIRDLLRQKAGEENEIAQKINQASHQGKDFPEEEGIITPEYFDDGSSIVEVDSDNNWPSDEKITEYRKTCAKHKSECKRMQVELSYFIANFGIAGGNCEMIADVESLRNNLLDHVKCLEKTFNVTPGERLDGMEAVEKSFNDLDEFVRRFTQLLDWKDSVKAKEWRDSTMHGYNQIAHFKFARKFVECLEFIDKFLPELEMHMGAVTEELASCKEKPVDKWLAMQKIELIEKRCEEYISLFPPKVSEAISHALPQAETMPKLRRHLAAYKESCTRMHEELEHLKSHYRIVGGDNAVFKAANLLQNTLLEPGKCLEQIMDERADAKAAIAAIASFARFHFVLNSFQDSLYHQKHAFYFRKVKKWVACIRNGLPKLLVTYHDMDCFMSYICDELLLDLSLTMIGASDILEDSKTTQNRLAMVDSGSVAEELKTFGKESLPKFLADQMERDTTRYVNLTTIATFFSSVTATTLQFTYAETDSVPSNSLRGVANLFWFLSLVFSVSSGVSSLLGLTWRKSSIYDSCVPPMAIHMWLDKAPMLFLIIAAVAFVIGLNLFAYLSLQPQYVSNATSILTGLHGACLLAVTVWFIYKLKYDSFWAVWFRIALKSVAEFSDWIISTGMEWIKIGIVCIYKSMHLIETGMKWIWRLVKQPYKKYKLNELHLHRNIYWAFGFDNTVARINDGIDWKRTWPEPYLLSKIIRCIAYPLKRCWIATEKALSDLSHTVRAHICVPSHTGLTGDDVEMGESVRREETEAAEEIACHSPSKNEFRKSLQTVFSNANCVEMIMRRVDDWEGYIITDEPVTMQYFSTRLWGYPDLANNLLQEIGPARKREIVGGLGDLAQQTISEVIGLDHIEGDTASISSHSSQPITLDESEAISTSHDEDDTTSSSSHSSQPPTLDDDPGSSYDMHRNSETDSRSQPDDSPPSRNSDEQSILTASGNTGASEHSVENQTDASEIEDDATAPNEIEEVTSMLEDTNEGLCNGQTEKDEGE